MAKKNDNEQWKAVAGYEGIYEVSNVGRIRSYHTGAPVLMHGGKEKAPKRYLKVVLSKNGKEKSFRIHRLVALAFIPNDTPEESPFVDHINGDYLDNRVENLR